MRVALQKKKKGEGEVWCETDVLFRDIIPHILVQSRSTALNHLRGRFEGDDLLDK